MSHKAMGESWGHAARATGSNSGLASISDKTRIFIIFTLWRCAPSTLQTIARQFRQQVPHERPS